MGEYNQKVAHSVTYGIDRNSRLGRGKFAYMNSMWQQLFNKFYEQGHDPESTARVVNRLLWRKDIIGFALLAARLICRLDFGDSKEVMDPLTVITHGFYVGAKEALDDVRLIS